MVLIAAYMNTGNEVGLQQGGINVKESDVIQAVKSSQITAAVPTTVAATTKQLVVRTTEEPCPEFFARACTHKCMTMNKMYLCSCPSGYQKRYHGHCSGKSFQFNAKVSICSCKVFMMSLNR